MPLERQLHAFILGLAVAGCVGAGETLYKFKGPDGRIVYSDRPPPGGRVDKVFTPTELPVSPLPDYVLRYRKELQKSVQARLATPASASDTVQLFTAQWCGYCRKARAYLGKKGIPYEEHDIDTPEGAAKFAQAGNTRGIPLLLWRDRRMQGFSPAGYDALFGPQK